MNVCNIFGRGGVLGYEIYLIDERFSSLVSAAAVSRENERGNYISSPGYSVEIAEISSFKAKLLGLENLVQTVFRGPSSVAADSNPWHLLRLLRSEAYANEHDRALRTLAAASASYSGNDIFDRILF